MVRRFDPSGNGRKTRVTDNTTVKIAVLATCFNRRDTTLTGLASLRAAAPGLDYKVYLVDDGSTDGTAQAVTAHHPEAQVLGGDGSLYWNGGMRKAWQAAIADTDYAADYYLWWNDDLILTPGAVADQLAFHRAKEALLGPKVITVGKVTDPDTGAVTYGGYARSPGWSKLRFHRVSDDGAPCDTINGNLVLIPARAVEEVGIHSPAYRHSTGDLDYGLRATRAGYHLFQTDHVVGQTPYNTDYLAKISTLNWANRKFIFTHPKGVPLGEWAHFCREHGGWIWPVNFFFRYAKMIGARA
jgi:GT2 family glycosyltransferase